MLSGTVSHLLIPYSVADVGSPPLSGWCICVCGCLSFVHVETFFSASTIHRESGLSLVGITGQIQVLTQYSFLAVWKTFFSGARIGEASPVGPESSQSDRYAPRFLNSASASMSDISLLDLLPRPPSLVPHHISRSVFSPRAGTRASWRTP